MLAVWYLHKVDQCARLAEAATDPRNRSRYISECREWLQILAQEIGVDVELLEAKLLLMDELD